MAELADRTSPVIEGSGETETDLSNGQASLSVSRGEDKTPLIPERPSPVEQPKGSTEEIAPGLTGSTNTYEEEVRCLCSSRGDQDGGVK